MLDAEVVGDHPPPGHAAAHRVALGRRDRGDEVDAVGAGLGGGGRPQRRLVGGAERPGHGAGVAQEAGEPAGVDAGDAGDAVAAQHRVEVGLGPPAAAPPGQFAHDHAAAEGPAGLEVGEVDPVVADVGRRERDDLAGVARIGDHLLIPGQHGVEHHLAGRHAAGRLRADRFTLEHRAVGEDELGLPHRHEQPSCMFMRSPA